MSYYYTINNHASDLSMLFVMLRFGEGRLCREVIQETVKGCRTKAERLFKGLPSNLRQAAIIVPLINAPEAGLLFEARSGRMRRHAGEVSFPGGCLQPGEDSWQCAVRECEEEIGWRPKEEEQVACLGGWHNRKANMLVWPWVVLKEGGLALDSLKKDPSEVEEIFHVNLETLMDEKKKDYRNLHHGWPPVPFFYPDGRHIIWGFTGFVLDALLKELTRNMK